MSEIIWSIIGYSILGGLGVSAGVYWLFKTVVDKWLTAKFSERLENFKHEQTKELENLRFEINALMDRTIKLHQNEFKILPA